MELLDEASRRHAVRWAIALTAETYLAPDHYEYALLERYVQGELSLGAILQQLDSRVQHVLYRSQAKHPLSPVQLTDLLEQSRAWNEAHQVTGLLCYTDAGQFVQVIEGAALDVHALFTKIRQDRRHHHVVLLSEKASARRWFADWQMALVKTQPHEFFWLLGYLDAKQRNLVQPEIPITDPQLLTLLQQFSAT